MQEMQVQSLGQEDALEEGIATYSWYPMDRTAWWGDAIAYRDTQSLTWLKQLSMHEECICQCSFLNSSYPLPLLGPHVLLKTQFKSMLRCHWCTMRACILSSSVTSDSLWPHGLESARLFCPWDSPGKNTGVECHFLLQRVFLTQELNPGLLLCRQIL